MDGEDQKPSKSKAIRPVVDRDACTASFAQYAGTVCPPREGCGSVGSLGNRDVLLEQDHVWVVEGIRRVAEAQLLLHGRRDF